MADSPTWSSLGLGALPPTAPSLSPASKEPPAFDADVKDDPTESVDWQDRVKVARQRHNDWLALRQGRAIVREIRRPIRWMRCSMTKRWSTVIRRGVPTPIGVANY
jgi:hypothetical protein